MDISVSSKGKYDSIKAILLVVIAFFLGPSIYTALMAAIDNGDTTKYLMLIGLLVVGIVLVLIYRLLSIEEQKEETDNTDEKPVADEKPAEKVVEKVEEKPDEPKKILEKVIESRSPKSADDKK